MVHTYEHVDKERLDKFLHELMPDRSRSALQKYIKQGAVTVNGRPTIAHHWLKQGDVIEIIEPATTKRPDAPSVAGHPRALFETPDYAILVKPAGLLIHPTEKNEPHTLSSWIIREYPETQSIGDPRRPGIIHRLDKDVGGLVLIARTLPAYDYFRELFRERKIHKKYQALVHGVVHNDHGEVSTTLERDTRTGKIIAQSALNTGRAALTRYAVIKRYRNYTLLDVDLVTGRTHQIRVHLSSIGHAIVGDVLYATRDVRKKRKVALTPQPLLYAYYLAFTDQQGNEKAFEIPIPEYFERALTRLT